MKWTKPTSGDIRKRKGFLFLPKGNSGFSRETRWLEYAKWTEVYNGALEKWEFAWWNDNEEEQEFRPS